MLAEAYKIELLMQILPMAAILQQWTGATVTSNEEDIFFKVLCQLKALFLFCEIYLYTI